MKRLIIISVLFMFSLSTSCFAENWKELNHRKMENSIGKVDRSNLIDTDSISHVVMDHTNIIKARVETRDNITGKYSIMYYLFNADTKEHRCTLLEEYDAKGKMLKTWDIEKISIYNAGKLKWTEYDPSDNLIKCIVKVLYKNEK